MTEPASIWFITACHGRFDLAKICLEQRARVIEELNGMGYDAHCIVAASDHNLHTAKEFGFDTINVPNDPLGAKVNAMIEYACREGSADYVVTMGSDDWCLASQFEELPVGEVQAAGMCGLVAPDGKKLLEVTIEPGEVGIIPWIIPRKLLMRSKFRPAKDRINKYIDGSIRECIKPKWNIVSQPWQMIDFKTPGENITLYEYVVQLRKNTVEHSNVWELLADKYPVDLCERMERLYASRRPASLLAG